MRFLDTFGHGCIGCCRGVHVFEKGDLLSKKKLSRFPMRNLPFLVHEVMVRLSSFGFCCGELAEVQAKLFKMAGGSVARAGEKRV